MVVNHAFFDLRVEMEHGIGIHQILQDPFQQSKAKDHSERTQEYSNILQAGR